jgi:hypothetical protein
MVDQELIAYWYQALASQHGVVLGVSDAHLIKQALYRARVQASDPDLARVQIRTSPDRPDSELWLVKGAKNGQTSI